MPSGFTFGRKWLTGHIENATSRRNIRPDIQGLRMLAVAAVVLDHLLHWPSGGFVGVDVFFVISGFLITGILLREHEKTGRISIVGFYKRRIRRIMPAAVVVIGATVTVAFFIFNRARFAQTGWDAVWALFFGANWRFASTGTDYFQASGPVSPLQHFWSLSVEEQFYFVWPFVMIAVLAVGVAHATQVRRRTITGIAMLSIILVSLGWAFVESTGSPTVAYFSTISRAWELGLGALIAIAAPWWARIPRSLRPLLGWAGLAGIVASYFLINDSLPFPAPWALLPVFATGLVIIAGTGGEQRFLYPLTNPVSFYVGNISYSLYLWHFPVIIFVTALIADATSVIIISVLLMLAASALSYHLIEVPVQQSPWLADRSKRSRRHKNSKDWSEWWTQHKPRYAYGGLAALAMTTAVLLAVLFAPSAPVTATPRLDLPTAAVSPTPGATVAPLAPEQAALQGEIVSALQSGSWPKLDPSFDSAIGGPQTPKDVGACGQVQSLTSDQCTWGSDTAAKRVLLVGDSVSLAYTEAFRTLSATANWSVETRGMFGCPFVDLRISNAKQEIVDACAQHNADTIREIQETRPDYVVITATYEVRVTAETQEKVSPSLWKKSLGNFVDQIRDDAKVVLLAPPPSSVNIQDCYTPRSAPADCITEVTQQYENTAAVERSLATSSGGIYVPVTELFCYSNQCPSFVDETPVKIDLVHITAEYARKMAPALWETLQAAGLS